MSEPAPVPPAGASRESTVRLIELFRSGDDAALDRLFARYLQPLRRWARGRLPDGARDLVDTQDLVQDTLLQTLKRIDVLDTRGEGAFHAYMRQAILNRVRNEIRRVSRRPTLTPVDSQTMDEGPTPLQHAIGAENMRRYETAIAVLKADARELVVARLELGLSYGEIAEALDRPNAEAARQAVGRAVKQLLTVMARTSSAT